MISLKNRQRGFTIVELLIVIVVIGILATLVITTYSGIQAKARDTKRQTDINTIQSHLEAYAADIGGGNYPTLANLQDSTWVKSNLKGLDMATFQDPKWSTSNTDCTGGTSPSQYAEVIDTAKAGCYEYTATTDANGNVTGYTISAALESGSTYSKTNP
ncbi:MAG TPA: type II secretion system protein [Candidatus Saccharimonadales bacterium]|nr:type II secretion system protein [Candidatus Saccharimonadales bacterium]